MVNNIVVDSTEDQELLQSYTDRQQEGLDDTSTDSLDDVVTGTDPDDETDGATEDDNSTYELPSKFQGKSVEDIVGSYAELERELGRKGQEIGELRKLSDEFLKTQIQNNQQNNPDTQDEETDFFEDPQAAIRREIDNHPKIKEAEKINEQSKQQATLAQINQQHPDAQQVVESKEFQEWVSQSKIRQRMFQDANNYDFDSAHELLSNWKERKLITKTHEVETAQKEAKASALKTGKAESRSSGDSIGSKKVYRRADLIRLKQTDPMRYDSMADEIFRAYADGRVK